MLRLCNRIKRAKLRCFDMGGVSLVSCSRLSCVFGRVGFCWEPVSGRARQVPIEAYVPESTGGVSMVLDTLEG